MSEEGHNYKFSLSSEQYHEGHDHIFKKSRPKDDKLHALSVSLAKELHKSGGSFHAFPVDGEMMGIESDFVYMVKVEKVRVIETYYQNPTYTGAE